MNTEPPAKTNRFPGSLLIGPDIDPDINTLLASLGINKYGGSFTLEEVAAIYSIAASYKILKATDPQAAIDAAVERKAQEVFNKLKDAK